MTTLNLNNKLALDEIQQVDAFLQQQIDEINTQISDIPALDLRVTNLENDLNTVELEQITQNN